MNKIVINKMEKLSFLLVVYKTPFPSLYPIL